MSVSLSVDEASKRLCVSRAELCSRIFVLVGQSNSSPGFRLASVHEARCAGASGIEPRRSYHNEFAISARRTTTGPVETHRGGCRPPDHVTTLHAAEAGEMTRSLGTSDN